MLKYKLIIFFSLVLEPYTQAMANSRPACMQLMHMQMQ